MLSVLNNASVLSSAFRLVSNDTRSCAVESSPELLGVISINQAFIWMTVMIMMMDSVSAIYNVCTIMSAR